MPGPAGTDALQSVPAGDKSIELLNAVFGAGWDGILEGGSGSNAIVFEMMSAFNAVVLAIVAVMMFYVISSGIIGTAHEGEALGKRYSTLWTPMRSAFSISLLMPLPWAKVSLLQAIIFKMIFFGIGGADYLNKTAADFMVQNGGQITAVAPKPSAINMTKTMLVVAVSQAFFNEHMGLSAGQLTTTMSSDKKIVMSFSPPAGSGLSSSDFGEITIDCSADTSVCQTRQAEVSKLYDTMFTAAQQVVSRYGDGANQDVDAGAITRAIQSYESTVQTTLQSAISNKNADLTKFGDLMTDKGWAMLGAWYWTLAGYNEEGQGASMAEPNITMPNIDHISGQAGSDFGAYLTRMDGIINKVETSLWDTQIQSTVGFGGSDSSGVSKFLAQIAHFYTEAGAHFVDGLSNGDPIGNLQSTGHAMIAAGGSSIMAFITASAMSGAAKEGINNSVFGWAANKLTGAPAAILGAVEKGLNAATPYIAMLLFTLLFAGVTLAYYLPAVPFILWTMGVLGWLVLVAETLIAAPLWAAGHAIPEGEGMAGQHGKQGYMLFLGILVRPALMVFGFFISYLLMNVVGKLIGEGFRVFTWGMNANSGGVASGISGLMPTSWFIGFVATLLVGSGIIIVASHKIFGLITWLPDNVMRWIGNSISSLGEHSDENRISGMVAGGVGRGQSAMAPQRAITGGTSTGGGQVGINDMDVHTAGAVEVEKADASLSATGNTDTDIKSI